MATRSSSERLSTASAEARLAVRPSVAEEGARPLQVTAFACEPLADVEPVERHSFWPPAGLEAPPVLIEALGRARRSCNRRAPSDSLTSIWTRASPLSLFSLVGIERGLA